MKQPLLIIKLGGSVVTDKSNTEAKVNTPAIKNISKQIRELLNQGYRLILVHGAGSFGHPLAKKHNLVLGIKTPEQRLGFSLMDSQMTYLNSIITKSLNNAGIPTIGLSPRSFTHTKNKELVELDLQHIKFFLEQELTPVLFGDGVYDETQGSSILSGDVIISQLAKELKTQKVIFLSDVDGVFDKNPKENLQAHLISQITNSNFKEVLKGLNSHNQYDVTGEMAGKVQSIKEHLSGCDVFIINGLKPESLLKVVNKDQVGTRLRFD